MMVGPHPLEKVENTPLPTTVLFNFLRVICSHGYFSRVVRAMITPSSLRLRLVSIKIAARVWTQPIV